jgi:hypothetical protein
MSVLALFLAAGATSALHVDAEALARAEHTTTDAGDFDETELTRARLGVALDLPSTVERVGLDLRLEAVRSAARDSVLGVAGDSLILRMATAQAVFIADAGPVRLAARGGLVEDTHRRRIATAWDLRVADAPLVERAQFGHTADLGGAVEASVFDGDLALEFAVTNGEGLAEAEQDATKNLGVTLSGVPLRAWDHALVASAQTVRGTRGAGSTRADALSGLLAVQGPLVGAGVEYTRLAGTLDRGERDADALGAWLRGEVWHPYIGLWARYDRLDTDYTARGSVQKRFGGGVYSTPVDAGAAGRLRLALGAQHDSAAAGSVPRPLPEVTRFLLGFELLASGGT